MLEYSQAALKESATAFGRIEAFLKRVKRDGVVFEKRISAELTQLMDDDLAVPQVLAQISEWMREANSTTDKKVISDSASKISGALSILGCDPDDYQNTVNANSEIINQQANKLVQLALQQREAARARKDFAEADRIRDEILKMGISIEDTPTGPRWSL
jgi:cysteinyl-tRNA synthetase